MATPQSAQPAAPAPVIRVPLDIAPVESTAAPQPTQRAETPAPARTARTAQRARPAAAAPVADTAPTAEITPIAAPMALPAEPAVKAAPLPAETATAATAATGDFPWEIAGGAAALLIVGGAGLAFARRRRASGAIAEDAPVERDAPVMAAAPAASDAAPWISPAYAPAPRTTPAFAAAPSGSMGRHEAMAMAGPTPDNPFATLNKRLKRARFLDRQERVAYDETLSAQKDMTRKPVSAWEIAQRPAPASQEQDVRRPEPARGSVTTTFRPGYSNR